MNALPVYKKIHSNSNDTTMRGESSPRESQRSSILLNVSGSTNEHQARSSGRLLDADAKTDMSGKRVRGSTSKSAGLGKVRNGNPPGKGGVIEEEITTCHFSPDGRRRENVAQTEASFLSWFWVEKDIHDNDAPDSDAATTSKRNGNPHDNRKVHFDSKSATPVLKDDKDDGTNRTRSSLDPETILTEMHVKEWQALHQLRDKVLHCMSEMGSAVYDIVALKDVLFTTTCHTRNEAGTGMGTPHVGHPTTHDTARSRRDDHESSRKEQEAPIPDARYSSNPSVPDNPIPLPVVTEFVVTTSRLYRSSLFLAKALSALLRIVFSTDFCDEHFHFTEMRTMRHSLDRLMRKNHQLSEENTLLQGRIRMLEIDIERARQDVSNLESSRNQLETKNATLEDEMALLFEQLTDDFLFYHEGDLDAVRAALGSVEAQGPMYSYFTNDVQLVQNKLQYFQTLLNEMRNRSGAPSVIPGRGTSTHGALRGKLRLMDSTVQALLPRLEAVRGGLETVTADLHRALEDKKRVVTLSIQHLKLYEIQNRKLRNARQLLHDLRAGITQAQRVMWQCLLPPSGGTYAMVYPNGAIAHFHENPIATGQQAESAPPLPPTSRSRPSHRPKPVSFSENMKKSSSRGASPLTPHPSTNIVLDADMQTGCSVHEINSAIEVLHSFAIKMIDTLNTSEEHRLFLQTLSRSVPSSAPFLHARDLTTQTLTDSVTRKQPGTVGRRTHSKGAAEELDHTQQQAHVTSKTIATLTGLYTALKGLHDRDTKSAGKKEDLVVSSSSSNAVGATRHVHRVMDEILQEDVVGIPTRAISTVMVDAVALSNRTATETSADGGAMLPPPAVTVRSLMMLEHDMRSVQKELVAKLYFMREVYEDRIAEVESRAELLTRKLTEAQRSARTGAASMNGGPVTMTFPFLPPQNSKGGPTGAPHTRNRMSFEDEASTPTNSSRRNSLHTSMSTSIGHSRVTDTDSLLDSNRMGQVTAMDPSAPHSETGALDGGINASIELEGAQAASKAMLRWNERKKTLMEEVQHSRNNLFEALEKTSGS